MLRAPSAPWAQGSVMGLVSLLPGQQTLQSLWLSGQLRGNHSK